MGNSCLKSRKKVTVLMVGLDNAGKTTATKGLIGECPEDVAPTLGFSSFHVKKHNFNVTIYDLGGASSIRGIWRNYLAEAFGFIFVVDASDEQRSEECREILHGLIKNPTVSGKPFLILANKQDVEGAVDEVELVGILEVEPIVNEARSRTRVETCSALHSGNGHKPDKNIQSGFRWLLTTIGLDYDNLKERIDQDVAVQREIEETERRAREERVRKLREERDKLEYETLEKETDEKKEFKNSGDPFKPISTIAKELETRMSEDETERKHSELDSEQINEVIEHERNEFNEMANDSRSKYLPSDCPSTTFEASNSSLDLHPYSKDDLTIPPGVVEVTPTERFPISRQSTLDEEDNQASVTKSPTKLMSVIGSDNEVIELEKTTKPRKRKMFSRNNKTAPSPSSEELPKSLPPLSTRSKQWISPTRSNSSGSHETPESEVKLSWGLAEELEIHDNSLSLQLKS